MRVLTRTHVLREILRLHEFADVMKIGANPSKRRVRSHHLGSFFSQVGDSQAMMISARRLQAETLEQGMVEIQP